MSLLSWALIPLDQGPTPPSFPSLTLITSQSLKSSQHTGSWGLNIEIWGTYSGHSRTPVVSSVPFLPPLGVHPHLQFSLPAPLPHTHFSPGMLLHLLLASPLSPAPCCSSHLEDFSFPWTFSAGTDASRFSSNCTCSKEHFLIFSNSD